MGHRERQKWYRYEAFVGHSGDDSMKKHGTSQAHRMATISFFDHKAQEVPLTVLLPKSVEEEELLQGAVPEVKAD